MDRIGASKVMRSTYEVSTALPDLSAVALAELTAQSATLGQAVLRAVPGRQVVLKVQSRCDLSCDHCYVYEAADQSWRGRPRVISDDIVEQTERRIAEHAVVHRLPEVQAVLHGERAGRR